MHVFMLVCILLVISCYVHWLLLLQPLLLKQKIPEVIEDCSLIQSKIVYHKCFDFIALHCILEMCAVCLVQRQKHSTSSAANVKCCTVVNDTNTIYLLMKMSKK